MAVCTSNQFIETANSYEHWNFVGLQQVRHRRDRIFDHFANTIRVVARTSSIVCLSFAEPRTRIITGISLDCRKYGKIISSLLINSSVRRLYVINNNHLFHRQRFANIHQHYMEFIRSAACKKCVYNRLPDRRFANNNPIRFPAVCTSARITRFADHAIVFAVRTSSPGGVHRFLTAIVLAACMSESFCCG
jgi:hypothetical protein